MNGEVVDIDYLSRDWLGQGVDWAHMTVEELKKFIPLPGDTIHRCKRVVGAYNARRQGRRRILLRPDAFIAAQRNNSYLSMGTMTQTEFCRNVVIHNPTRGGQECLIHHVCREGASPEAVEYICQTDPEALQRRVGIHCPLSYNESERGYLPLHCACLAISTDVVDAILNSEEGGEEEVFEQIVRELQDRVERVMRFMIASDPKAATDNDNHVEELPLHTLINYSCMPTLEMVKGLVDAYPKALNMCDTNGNTPLEAAMDLSKKISMLKLLLRPFPATRVLEDETKPFMIGQHNNAKKATSILSSLGLGRARTRQYIDRLLSSTTYTLQNKARIQEAALVAYHEHVMRQVHESFQSVHENLATCLRGNTNDNPQHPDEDSTEVVIHECTIPLAHWLKHHSGMLEEELLRLVTKFEGITDAPQEEAAEDEPRGEAAENEPEE